MTYSVSGIVFDLDGTLVHTAPQYRHIVVSKTLKDLGVRSWNHEDVDRFWFCADRRTIIQECFGVERNAFWAAYRMHDSIELRLKMTYVYGDVPEALRMFRDGGVKLGVVTGAPLHIAGIELEKVDIRLFDAVIFNNPKCGFAYKPNSAGLERCLEIMGVLRNSAMYVGNADEDVYTARSAGVDDVLVDRGEHVFPGLQPSHTVSDLLVLERILRK
ncbi:HAD hydrolase-like protein [Candidatus Woesearchaeota archaeon]|nr:HAD hydrolase-like protein [Candidatus Woesearchaeota archaeon]